MDIIDDAVYSLIHDFSAGNKRGAPALAGFLRTNYGYNVQPGTLMNKANPEQDHHLTVREGLLIQRAQSRFPLLHAEAQLLGHVAIPLGDFANTSDMELLNTYTNLHSKIGSLANTIRHSLEDNVITHRELQEIKRSGREVIRAMLEMENRMAALAEAEV